MTEAVRAGRPAVRSCPAGGAVVSGERVAGTGHRALVADLTLHQRG
ncbi:hypothetical protein [Streptomyces sp. NPDC007205]